VKGVPVSGSNKTLVASLWVKAIHAESTGADQPYFVVMVSRQLGKSRYLQDLARTMAEEQMTVGPPVRKEPFWVDRAAPGRARHKKGKR
jgi:hypothetical protein